MRCWTKSEPADSVSLHSPHGPRPIIQVGRHARKLILGQTPGARVHALGEPWRDASATGCVTGGSQRCTIL